MKDITIIGYLGNDAEVKAMKSGNGEFLTVRVAVRDDKDDKSTYWFNVRTFDPFHIKHLAQYLKKGKQVCISGDYTDRLYADKDGNCQISREINAYKIRFVNNDRRQEQGQEQNTQQPVQMQQVNQEQQKQAVQPVQTVPVKPETNSVEEDDSLPF